MREEGRGNPRAGSLFLGQGQANNPSRTQLSSEAVDHGRYTTHYPAHGQQYLPYTPSSLQVQGQEHYQNATYYTGWSGAWPANAVSSATQRLPQALTWEEAQWRADVSFHGQAHYQPQNAQHLLARGHTQYHFRNSQFPHERYRAQYQAQASMYNQTYNQMHNQTYCQMCNPIQRSAQIPPQELSEGTRAIYSWLATCEWGLPDQPAERPPRDRARNRRQRRVKAQRQVLPHSPAPAQLHSAAQITTSTASQLRDQVSGRATEPVPLQSQEQSLPHEQVLNLQRLSNHRTTPDRVSAQDQARLAESGQAEVSNDDCTNSREQMPDSLQSQTDGLALRQTVPVIASRQSQMHNSQLESTLQTQHAPTVQQVSQVGQALPVQVSHPDRTEHSPVPVPEPGSLQTSGCDAGPEASPIQAKNPEQDLLPDCKSTSARSSGKKSPRILPPVSMMSTPIVSTQLSQQTSARTSPIESRQISRESSIGVKASGRVSGQCLSASSGSNTAQVTMHLETQSHTAITNQNSTCDLLANEQQRIEERLEEKVSRASQMSLEKEQKEEQAARDQVFAKRSQEEEDQKILQRVEDRKQREKADEMKKKEDAEARKKAQQNLAAKNRELREETLQKTREKQEQDEIERQKKLVEANRKGQEAARKRLAERKNREEKAERRRIRMEAIRENARQEAARREERERQDQKDRIEQGLRLEACKESSPEGKKGRPCPFM